MNPALHTELDRLKERQAHLLQAVDLLGTRIDALEQRLAEEARMEGPKPVGPEAGPSAAAGRVPGVNAPMTVPPVLNTVAATPPEGRNIQPLIAQSQPATFKPQSAIPSSAMRPPVTFTPLVPPPVAAPALSKPSESFELRLGTYWLVRIGIVAMLTALVFFGTYAYQNFIGQLGPVGKVSLLYLASGALLGCGAWWQRRAAKESLRNYAQVLFAGGLAAVYFTTYAAHHFPNLQIIASATLDGALLLGWTGYMAWTADRKKSEVLAVFAVGLAYYSSVITHAGHFTLYSNLVLTTAVLFFLVRNRWAMLSFGSLVATYASYGFWRFHGDGGWQWAGPEAGLWTGVCFLAAYWLIFTAAVFLSRHEQFAGVNRASFATLNNGAFFALFLLTMWQVHSGGFWRFCLGYGAVLSGASVLARLRLREEPLAANTYLTQGLLLVTVGFIAKFSGLHLALVLALESAALWMAGTFNRNLILRTSACVSAALATLWVIDGMEPQSASGAWLGAGVGGLLAWNGFWSHARGQSVSPRLMRTAPTYFSLLALIVWSFALWQNVVVEVRPVAFAVLAVVLSCGLQRARLREFSLLAQLLLPVGALDFVVRQPLGGGSAAWWSLVGVAGPALVLVHWWQRQTRIECPRPLRMTGQLGFSLMLVMLIGSWLEPRLNARDWVLVGSGLGLAMTGYGAATRNGALAAVAQSFAAVGTGVWLIHAGPEQVTWLTGLVPLATLAVLGRGGKIWAAAQPEGHPVADWVRQMAVMYGRGAMGLVVWWLFAYVPERQLAASLAAAGAVAFGWAGGRNRREWLGFSAVLNACSLAVLGHALVVGHAVYLPDALAIGAWMVEQQVARRQAERYALPAAVHTFVILAAGTSLWWLATQWVMQGFSGFYLTASWSVFAFLLLALGVARRERLYRWLGLGIVGAAVGRVVIFDVWRLETLYRILSFFALGLVLLVLGFIYNKYQERIRQWL